MRITVRALMLVAAFLATGCSTNPTGSDRGSRLGVTAGTMVLIERSGSPAEKAAKVLEAVKRVRTLLDDKSTVGDLRSALLARVAKENPSPAERLVAIEFVNAVADEVERRIGVGYLTPDAIISINAVLDWVADAASAYVQNPVAS